MMKPDEQYGPVGSRILFENDLVRVWEISLEPGEHLPLHYHALPYLVVTIEAAHVRVVEQDGQEFGISLNQPVPQRWLIPVSPRGGKAGMSAARQCIAQGA